MSKLLNPKFKFGLYLVEQTKKYNNQNSANGQPTFCYADVYEISQDGSITFFQTLETDDGKKLKAPVLTYPQGKWEACVLFDINNQNPVFTGKGSSTNIITNNGNNPGTYNSNNNSNTTTHSSPSNNHSNNNNSNNNSNNKNIDIGAYFLKDDNNESSDLDDLVGGFSDSDSNNTSQPFNNSNSNNSNPNNSSNNFNQGNQHNSNQWNRNNSNNNNNNGGMPGIAQNNPAEFKKLKNEFLESQVKEFSKTNTGQFVIKDFLSYLMKNPKSRDFGKLTETDVEWTVAKLLREKSLLARKFSDPAIQKTLALILPDIMKRQWSGKMGPIIQVLQEREETKNVNAIDLAAWMASNNFS